MHWLETIPGSLDPAYISERQFPKTFAYIERFRTALQGAQAAMPKPVRLPMTDIMKNMAESSFYESVGEFDANDPLGLKPGEMVSTSPTDTGAGHRDTGKLVSLTPNEVVIAKQTKAAPGFEIHVHMPRWGFRVLRAKGEKI